MGLKNRPPVAHFGGMSAATPGLRFRLPAAFALLAVEVLFRMRRLWLGERAPRDDSVSAS